MTTFDYSRYRLHLAAERQRLRTETSGVDLSFANIVFDETKHPRLHGKFAKVPDHALHSFVATNPHTGETKAFGSHTPNLHGASKETALKAALDHAGPGGHVTAHAQWLENGQLRTKKVGEFGKPIPMHPVGAKVSFKGSRYKDLGSGTIKSQQPGNYHVPAHQYMVDVGNGVSVSAFHGELQPEGQPKQVSSDVTSAHLSEARKAIRDIPRASWGKSEASALNDYKRARQLGLNHDAAMRQLLYDQTLANHPGPYAKAYTAAVAAKAAYKLQSAESSSPARREPTTSIDHLLQLMKQHDAHGAGDFVEPDNTPLSKALVTDLVAAGHLKDASGGTYQITPKAMKAARTAREVTARLKARRA